MTPRISSRQTYVSLAMTALLTAGAIAAPVTPQGIERKAILDALRAPVQQELAQPVEFAVERIVVSGAWAFVIATPQGREGAEIAWEKTVCEGDVSHLVGGLLRSQDGAWTVQALALCPTDVAWATWADEHKAPAELFGLD